MLENNETTPIPLNEKPTYNLITISDVKISTTNNMIEGVQEIVTMEFETLFAYYHVTIKPIINVPRSS